MVRGFPHFLLAATFLLLPARLMAGGPPCLCLPIEGVTPDNVQACAELLTTKLDGKLWPHDRGIQIQRHSNQWYLKFYMGEHVALGDVEAALEGSGFSVPRGKLRLFGHVILEIDARPTEHTALLTDLDALHNVSVAESEDTPDRLLVTVDMPYPLGDGGSDRESVGWETFQRNGLSSNQSTESRDPATPRLLPSYDSFREIVEKHSGSLNEVRWSTQYACRPLGGVVAPDPDAVVSAEAALPAGKWNVEFTNGVTEVCDIFNSAGGQATVDEPRRRSRGTVAVQDGSLVIIYEDDRVERWTSVGERFVVEHWYPGSRFPAATPVLGIAERVP